MFSSRGRDSLCMLYQTTCELKCASNHKLRVLISLCKPCAGLLIHDIFIQVPAAFGALLSLSQLLLFAVFPSANIVVF
jgi:hypothetical protein